MVLAASAIAAASPSDGERERAVEDAIRAAVLARTGEAFTVGVETRTVRGQGRGPFLAVPEPSARAGRPAVFALAMADPASPGGQRRVGSAVAVVSLEGPHVRTARSLTRGAVLEAGDLQVVHGVVEGLALEAPSGIDALVGTRATRDLRAGEIVTASLVQAEPHVRSGEEVRVRVVVDGLEAQGRGIASQSGSIGSVVRIVNPDSRRAFKARVTGRGEVEVVHAR